MRLWMVRLGKFGEQEAHAMETGELVTGWNLSDISKAESREAILPALEDAYPDEKPGTLRNWAVQLNQFKNVAEAGDLVVTPLKTTGQIAIGRLEAGYSHSVEGHPVRRVKWIRTDLPRGTMKQDLLFSLGASQTVCEIWRNGAAERFATAAGNGIDPGHSTSGKAASVSSPPSPDGGDENVDDTRINLAGLARDQIEKRISSHFAGHAFTQLIAAILRAQGYQANVSPAGPDRGIDIVAGQGPLGLSGQKLVVQVKSGDIVADQPTLQGLLGCVNDVRADHGLLVSWSGFTPPVRKRVNELYFRVRLWGRDEILDALFATYDQLPAEMRAELPLRQVWSLVPEEEAVG